LIWGDLPLGISFLNYPVLRFGATIFKNREVAFAIAMGIGLAFYLFLTYSRTGKAIRAASQDPTTAGLMGVNIDMMLALCFGLGSLLTGFAAVLYMTCFPVIATMGLRFTLIAIIVVVLGGLGSIPGCFIGGFMLGIIGNILEWTEPVLALPAFYFIFLILLLVKPTGIMGKR
jgi:branched-subunit amino acid ABC-type transport system permease component